MTANEPLRVLHCLPWIAGGGVERRRLMLARFLDRSRYQQRIVVRSCMGTVAKRLRDEGVEVIELGEGRLFEPRLMAKAIRIAREYRPHIVHGAVFEGVAMALVAGRACGAKVVAEETSHATNRSRAGHALFRGLVALSDACVAISPAVGDYLVEVTGVPRQRVTVITNGVFAPVIPDTDRVELRQALGLSPEAFVVGTVCRLVDDSHKRVSDLIRATALLGDLPAFRLLVVGSGKEREGLEQLARSLGVSDQVHFAGYRDNVGAMYKTMDVFALVSSREGFGQVVAEAMLANLPVIATSVGGINDIVDDGRTGVLVRPCDPELLAQVIRRLHDAPLQRSALASAGAQRARELFSAERYTRDVDSFYCRLTGKPSPAPAVT